MRFLLLLVLAGPSFAQFNSSGPPGAVIVGASPSGQTCTTATAQAKIYNGTIYTCQGGTYAAVSGGGSSLPSGTGIVKVTNGTGALATAGTDYLTSSSLPAVNIAAKCDGTTDDTATINNAIAAATSGGTLVLPTGSCKLTGTGIAIAVSKVTLRGQGIKATSLLAPIANTSAVTVSAVDVAVQDLGIDGQYALQGTSNSGINLSGLPHNFRMERVWIHDTTSHGLSSTGGTSDITIKDCRFTNLGLGATVVMATPAPTTTTFPVSPGTSGNFTVGQSLRIGTQTGTISSIQTVASYVATGTSTTAFTVNIGAGSLFSAGNVIHVGAQTCTISTVVSDTITCSSALSSAVIPNPGQLVAIDNITLSSAITAPTAGNTVAQTGTVQKAIYMNNSIRPSIVNSYFAGWSQAIGLWYGVTDALVEGNTAVQNYGFETATHDGLARSAIEFYENTSRGAGIRAIGNYVDGSTNDCFEIAQGTVGLSVIGNTCKNWGYEVGFTGYSNEGMGLQGQSGTPGALHGVVLIGNTITSSGVYGSNGVNVKSGFTTGVSLNANIFQNFTAVAPGACLSLQTTATVTTNVFDGCLYGVSVLTSDPNGSILGNNFMNIPPHVSGGLTYQINFGGSGTGWSVTSNVINDTAYSSRGICLCGSAAVLVQGNSITASSAMWVNTNDNVITGNTFTFQDATQGSGIRLTGARNRIDHNTFRAPVGITTITLVASGADYNQISQNSFPNATTLSGGIDTTSFSTATHNVIAPNTSNNILNSWPIPTVSSGGSVVTGSTDIAGTLSSTTAGTWAPVLTFKGLGAANTGWNCTYFNLTTPANAMLQTASTTTTATASGTTASGDQIRYSCSQF